LLNIIDNAEQTTQQQAQNSALSADRRHSSRHHSVRHEQTDDRAAAQYCALSANRRHSSRHCMVLYQLTYDTAAGTVWCSISGTDDTVAVTAARRGGHHPATQPDRLRGVPRPKGGGCDCEGVALIVATRSSPADAPWPMLGARQLRRRPCPALGSDLEYFVTLSNPIICTLSSMSGRGASAGSQEQASK
jgi:hypothetical protein